MENALETGGRGRTQRKEEKVSAIQFDWMEWNECVCVRFEWLFVQIDRKNVYVNESLLNEREREWRCFLGATAYTIVFNNWKHNKLPLLLNKKLLFLLQYLHKNGHRITIFEMISLVLCVWWWCWESISSCRHALATPAAARSKNASFYGIYKHKSLHLSAY